MILLWTSHQNFTQHARSSLATADLATSTRFWRSNDEDTKPKTLYNTPWNGSFFMPYKGHLLIFRRRDRTGEFSTREEVSVTCFGRSPKILKELLTECFIEYSKLARDKTSLYEHHDGAWARSVVMKRRFSWTVILNQSRKTELLEDIQDFLNPTSRQWYCDRDIPYRRGYLLYGPPGTGKSSLSLALAGHFGLDIYTLSLSTITKDRLTSLFAKLPSRCVILLEDIDAVSSNRSGEAEIDDSRQIATASSQKSRSASGKVSLSALLNVIDGVGSQEGRILIMTTNHITRLDDALIRPGRVDKKVELGLADNKMIADLFCFVFKTTTGDAALPKIVSLDVLVHEAAVCQSKMDESVEQLAEEFAGEVPELTFSPAEILSFLLEHRKSPRRAIDNVEQLTSKSVEVRSKPPFEEARPGDTQPDKSINIGESTL
jgi:chaperone BCS1